MIPRIVLFISVALSHILTTHSFRVLTTGEKTPNGAYFKPYDKGFVGTYGDPKNFQRERVNEGAFETTEQELLFEGSSPRQSCPGMVGPFSDGNYYCTAREYGYCDRRSGTCFCNVGYKGIDCSDCHDSHFLIGSSCFPKKLCPNDCSGAGSCNFETGVCSCLPHRTGVECETLLCTHHSDLCETCTKDECLKCASGYYLTGVDDRICGSCYDFDPRCAGCTKEEGCTTCADSTLTSVLRSGYRSNDPELPIEELTREFSITLPFGTKSPESFADSESYSVVTTADQPLHNMSVSCEQGLNNDETWTCTPFEITHAVCGHFGVFSFLYPNYEVSERAKSIPMSVRRTGGGYGSVQINYFIKHFTTDDSDLVATKAYTTSQRLDFDEGVIERKFYISILDDNVVEENEVFQVVLEIPEGGGSVGAQFRANVTIIDDDADLIAPKLTRPLENRTTVAAGEPFSVSVQAIAANGQMLNTGGETFFAIIENDLDLWSNPQGAKHGDLMYGGAQRNSMRHQCEIEDSGLGLYTVHCPEIREQGQYQLRLYHCFPNAIRGEYFYDGFFERHAVTRLDHVVNFTWGYGRLTSRGSDFITIRWSGVIMAPSTGEYAFKIEADDHVRFWINGDLLVDHWHEMFANLEPSRTVYLEEGVLQEVVIEYREVDGEAHARLMWGINGSNLEVVPQESFFSLFELDRSPILVTTTSTDTYAPTTECTGDGLLRATARHRSEFTICPRDRFRNFRDDIDEFFLSTQMFSADMVLEDDEHHGVGAEVITVSLVWDASTHCFDASYVPERAGDYRLDVVYREWRSDDPQHVAGSPFFLTVEPDQTSGPLSDVKGLPKPLYMEAGDCFNFTVVSRDNAQNLRLKGGDVYTIYTYRIEQWDEKTGRPLLSASPSMLPSSVPTSIPTSMPTGLYENAYFSVSPVSDAGVDVVRYGTVTDHANGNYTLQICPVISGTHELHILHETTGVSNMPFRIIDRWNSYKYSTGFGTHTGQYVAEGPYSLVVAHSTASIVTSTVVGDGLVGCTVGIPVTFLLTVRDSYDNVLRDDIHKPTVGAVLDRSPEAVVNVWDYKNGSYLIEYTALLTGDNILSVYVNGFQIQDSPFTVPALPGVTSEEFSVAYGSGLHDGTAGVPSFFEVFGYDLQNNRILGYNDLYYYTVTYIDDGSASSRRRSLVQINETGEFDYSGYSVPCPSPPVPNHPICSFYDDLGAHYFGSFVPEGAGTIEIRIYLVSDNGELIELEGSPFYAVIVPADSVAENTQVVGEMYDSIGGVESSINLQLLDAFNNSLISGGKQIELALYAVAIDWGVTVPFEPQGPPNEFHYKGFYVPGFPVEYGTVVDYGDGRYTINYRASIAGEYVMRLSLVEPGLNATYFNSTNWGFMNDVEARNTIGLNTPEHHTMLSWTGDAGGAQAVRGDRGVSSYKNRFTTRTESNIDFDLNHRNIDGYLNNLDMTIDQSEREENITSPTEATGRYNFRNEFWSARWTGMITPVYAEVYKFTVKMDSDSTVMMTIGGRGADFNRSYPTNSAALLSTAENPMAAKDGVVLVLSSSLSTNGARSTTLTGYYNFTDTLHREIVVEYSHNSGDAVLQLSWESPSTPFSVIPAEAFTHWRNMTHHNTTIHPAALCSECSTVTGEALRAAEVGVKKSFLLYGRDIFDNLLQTGGNTPSMVAFGQYGVAFRGEVTDYGNSTYLIEYYPTQAGVFRMYVSIGCCTPPPGVGQHEEMQVLRNSHLLVKGAPFLLTVTPAPVAQARTVAVGSGLLGGRVGTQLAFTVLYRDLHNNPTTADASNQLPEDALLEVTFHDSVTMDLVEPTHLSIEYSNSNISVAFSHTRAEVYLMTVYLTIATSIPGRHSGESDFVTTTREQIIGSPFTVILTPSVAEPSLTVSRGVGLRQAASGVPASFEVQLFDEFNNKLLVGGDKFYMRVLGDMQSLMGTYADYDAAIPSCVDSREGRYVCSYTIEDSGVHNITIDWLQSAVTHPGGAGLRGTYFNTLSKTAAPDVTRVDSVVSFHWNDGYMIPISSSSSSNSDAVPLSGSGQFVRWTGYLVAPRTDDFYLAVRSTNANTTIFLDSVLVFDSLRAVKKSVPLVRDAAYKIIVEASVESTSAVRETELPYVGVQLVWSTVTIKEYEIPSFFLYADAEPVALSPFPVSVDTVTVG